MSDRIRRFPLGFALGIALSSAGALAHPHGSGGPPPSGDYTLAESLLSPTPTPGDPFGSAVAAGGPYVAVGSPASGKVHLLDRSTGGVVRTFQSPNPTPGDQFGAAVSMANFQLLVGAPRDDSAGTDAGAVYLFDAHAGGPPLQSFFDPSPAALDDFGRSVAFGLFAGTFLIGAPGDDAAGPNAGAAYVFSQGPGPDLTLTKPPPIGTSAFGSALIGMPGFGSLLAPSIAVGDSADGAGAAGSGAVFVFNMNGVLRYRLNNPQAAANAKFGAALARAAPSSDLFAISQLVVGAPALGAPGRVDVFNQADGAFVRSLASGAPSPGDWFGYSLAGLGPQVLAGAPKDDTGTTDAGAAYLFDLSNGALLKTLPNPTPAADDRFGYAVGSSCNELVAGAPQDGASGPLTGAAHLYLPTRAACSVSGTPQQIGWWDALTSAPATAIHMHVMGNRKVLFYGGGVPTKSYVLDPATGTIEQHGTTPGELFCGGHAALDDGRVISIGGNTGLFDGIRDTYIFDPAAQAWTPMQDMHQARWYPTATTLGDGRVLALGGQSVNDPKVHADIPEIFNATTNTWTQLTGAQRVLGLYPFMFLLPNGKLFQAGQQGTGSSTLDLATQAWANVDTSRNAAGAAAMYLPGKVLKAGGTLPPGGAVTNVADRIDMTAATPDWVPTGSMANPRQDHNLVLIPDGSVLAVGGRIASDTALQSIRAAERWNPQAGIGTWTTLACMEEPRMYHSTAVLLPDGRVLSAGGDCYPSYQIYSPPYLFAGPRPRITSAPGFAGYDTSFTVQTPDSASIQSVALMRPGSTTHSLDMNQRYIPLTFTQGAGSLQVTVPPIRNVTPPGDYMLFLVNASGVPSEAHMIEIGGPGGC